MQVTQTTKRKKYIQRAIGIILLLIAVNIAASYFHLRLDLTAEKRYTLAPSTKTLLRNLKEPVSIEVFLKGEFPAGFRQLAQSTRDLLEEFREYGKDNVHFVFVNPGTDLPDSTREAYQDSLMAKGIMPFNLQVQQDAKADYSEKLLFPGALITYKGKSTGVNLLKNVASGDPQQSLNSSEALLEYQFANAIAKLQEEHPPVIGYAQGHGEQVGLHMYDALNTLQTNYLIDTVNIRTNPFIPKDFAMLLIAKSTVPFNDSDKLKIDQYVMNGGKVLWMIDNTTADTDTLEFTNQFVAFDRQLGLEDLLFRYGARINIDLVQDLQSDMVPLIVGRMGDRPQIEPVPIPYFPLITPTGKHPIVKNMDVIMTRFPSSIDTVKGGDIRKTVLLATSAHSRTVRIPMQISLEDMKQKPNAREFRSAAIPVAVLLEGKFTSLFNHHIPVSDQQAWQSASGMPYKTRADKENSMIIVSDADIITNAVSKKEGPLQMGINPFNQSYVFANKEFFLNSLEYLTGNASILETRNKELTLRLLDSEKVKQEKTKWQIICFAVPIALVLLFASIFNFIRQRKYAA
ncbi:gliding-associated putative ABC transporter substrate-binding component GldG [Chitinophaga skermanii]|uniref:Gliding-associated putative ABC transporter substrate-binding component GldG n=1 Tax=Chitinophaga skermanii TaxID=331697 RepID=A0A327QQN1_9BACT|nr:gliding motility-associated ABC transporter substrate-binding protein GldG [Chitinophaga skermanii]RAJ04097.1 gliding-associated putative ABC transporter substrate-binding component GldG [Chitinophaga skermanii]